MDPWQLAAEYHHQTKHHFNRYARSLGYMDWANQPDPFRRFEGAAIKPLLIEPQAAHPLYDDLFSPGRVDPRPVDIHSISAFFQYSLAISAWKQYGDSRWALRINPSSGNLHPTEGYLLSGGIRSIDTVPGVYHYSSKDHVLEKRTEVESYVWDKAVARFPDGTFFVGLTSIHWREVWKYGERGYRYCQHDAGHALAAIALSAAHLGWSVRWLDEMSDGDVEGVLGIDRKADFEDAEREHPDMLMAIIPNMLGGDVVVPRGLTADAIDGITRSVWRGAANRLSTEHVDWDWINAAEEACRKPAILHSAPPELADPDSEIAASESPLAREHSARKVFFQRRSALDFDGQTRIEASIFFHMLKRVMPRSDQSPWNTLTDRGVYVHLLLFVHRVTDLPPGLYFLSRSFRESVRDALRASMRSDFLWQKPEGCPAGLPLYTLLHGDARKLSAQVSCGQAIASDGAFAISMMAEFEEPLRERGAWMYRRLHWETGMIGQVLYLEAEAAGIRSTGIGCFFDDPVHDLLGLQGSKYQDLYHFTLGGPVEDTRLTTLPPYGPDVVSRRA